MYTYIYYISTYIYTLNIYKVFLTCFVFRYNYFYAGAM